MLFHTKLITQTFTTKLRHLGQEGVSNPKSNFEPHNKKTKRSPKSVKWKLEISPFPSDPPHVNPEEYQGTDPRAKHHTQSAYHPHSLWQEPTTAAEHQLMPSFLSSCSPLQPFTLPHLSPSKGSNQKSKKTTTWTYNHWENQYEYNIYNKHIHKENFVLGRHIVEWKSEKQVLINTAGSIKVKKHE